MFKKILIANRGEIAVRIIRACREMGIASVAVYSTADKDSLHVYMADEAVCIGRADSRDSYLNIPNILAAATTKGVDAIHPGFGFLSENSKFAKLCEELNIKFIGPTSDVIALLGDKAMAKKTMQKAGVPTIPGSKGTVKDLEEAKKIAEKTSFPLLIKASNGGGGRGIKLVNSEDELESNFDMAKREALAFFGEDGVYIEKYLTNTKHIEFQILADELGNVIHLGERDCSMQRRNQKMVEESPSPALDEALRKKMGDIAVKGAKAAEYTNAGTIEFLLDENNNFYFMEMNTRIQVEHPVTEMVTGVDLIKEQIKIAYGDKLDIKQKDIKLKGSAIEVRINAEDPKKDFAPQSGIIDTLHIPNGFNIRFDSHLYTDYKLPIHYDSMLGKLIVKGEDRDEAIEKMKSAIHELVIEGVITNAGFARKLISSPDFASGDFDTGYLEKFIEKNK